MKSINKLSMAACVALAMALAAGCMSNDNETAQTSMRDKAFVKDAAKAGMKEVEMGRLGAERAQSPQVKQLAQRILTDHTRANQELMSIARQNDIETPDEARQPGDIDHMESLSGPEFDRMYVMHMLRDHQRDIRKFETAAQSAENPQVRDFAARTLPILQEHLRMAESIASARGYAGTMISESSGAQLQPGVYSWEALPSRPASNTRLLGGNRKYLGGDRVRRHHDTWDDSERPE